MRIGLGYDSHRLVKGRKLIIGGVEIPSIKGSLGHSDADVLCHAIIDSIIGALGLGGMGKYFPDTDNRWKDASSIEMLSKTVELMKKDRFEVLWIDSLVIVEKPRLEPFIDEMRKNISKTGLQIDTVNIKAKTDEGLGFIGSGEGIAAKAVCLLKPV